LGLPYAEPAYVDHRKGGGLTAADDILSMLEERREGLVTSESLSTAKVPNARSMIEANEPTYQALDNLLGLSDGVKRLVAAYALQLAAAQAEFDAAVQVREAIAKVIEELRELQEREGLSGDPR
jgi:5-bromo-4-chloroindolyl phosphate hydrolysis protein